MARLLERFLDLSHTSLKICGFTRREDVEAAISLEVDAIGINFWPKSKRFCPVELAEDILLGTKNKILRVGVFVNQDIDFTIDLVKKGLIDVVQFHGDESPEDLETIRQTGIPFCKALGIKNEESAEFLNDYDATAVLLDAHCPGIYGGTGESIDWSLAKSIVEHTHTPIILAGGIDPTNAAEATRAVLPCAIDAASGSESAPGIKDYEKMKLLKLAVDEANAPIH